MVYTGLEWPPTCHKYDTNDTNTAQDRAQSVIDRALSITQGIGTRECIPFRKKYFHRYESLCLTIASGYRRIAEEEGYVKANQSLLSLDQQLQVHDFNLACDLDTLKVFADKLARQCVQYQSSHAETEALAACRRLAALYGITTPSPDDFNGWITPVFKRLTDNNWWRRKLQRIQKQRIDEVARDLRTVQHQVSPYVSGWGLNYRQQQKQHSEHYLSSTTIVNENGDQFTLQEIANRSVSNPAIRRAELMTRAKGFEMVADHYGHVADFYTITTPSRMHAQLKAKTRNPKFDGTTPSQAQDYLNHLWTCVRSKLHRQGIYVYGFRVVEPHHDGTPHWHLLLFMQPEHRKIVRTILRSYSLKDDGKEPGAATQRLKAIAIEAEKGSAAGYIAKYIAKNIDGSHIDQDSYGNEATSSAERIEAWASIHGIRQFQQIGGPSVTVWRELRRLNTDNAESVNSYFQPADAGDWAAFVMVMGGPTLRRCERPLRPYYHQEDISLPTGELNPLAITQYGDVKKPVIKGLINGGLVVPTRLRKWHVLNASPA